MNDEITLKQLLLNVRKWLKFVLSKWIFILVVGFLFALCATVYKAFKSPIYTATTSFVLENSDGGGLSQYSSLASMAGLDVGENSGGLFQGDNIIELYKSRTMIEKTLLSYSNLDSQKKLLVNKYIEFKNLRKDWNENPALINYSFSANPTDSTLSQLRIRDSLLNIIVKDISTNSLVVNKLDKKLSIIIVTVKAEDEMFAKSFNDQIVQNVNEFYIQTKTKKSQENVSILQRKTDSVRSVMNGSIYSAAAIVDATPNLNPTRQTQRVAPLQKSQVSAETNKIILQELIKNLELSKLSLLKEAPLIQIVDKPIFPLENDNHGKLKFGLFGFIIGVLAACFVVVFNQGLKIIMK